MGIGEGCEGFILHRTVILVLERPLKIMTYYFFS